MKVISVAAGTLMHYGMYAAKGKSGSHLSEVDACVAILPGVIPDVHHSKCEAARMAMVFELYFSSITRLNTCRSS